MSAFVSRFHYSWAATSDDTVTVFYNFLGNFNRYFIIFLILFFIEVNIAYFLKTGFIRHTFGDYLVVILIYCFIKSFLNMKPFSAAIGVLLFAFSIELLQLVSILEVLNLQNNSIAKLILGNTFQISDLIAYTFGIISVLFIERRPTYLNK